MPAGPTLKAKMKQTAAGRGMQKFFIPFLFSVARLVVSFPALGLQPAGICAAQQA